MNKLEIEFLRESNAIEREYSRLALEDAKMSWEFAKRKDYVSMNQILGVHKLLMQNVYPGIAGKIRNVDVRVSGTKLIKPELIKKSLEALILIKPKTEKEIKDWHITFENIHPFVDGNGRTGRIIMNYQRLRNNLPLLVIHRGKEQFEYYDWFKR